MEKGYGIDWENMDTFFSFMGGTTTDALPVWSSGRRQVPQGPDCRMGAHGILAYAGQSVGPNTHTNPSLRNRLHVENCFHASDYFGPFNTIGLTIFYLI